MTFNVIQEHRLHKLQTKTTNYETAIKLLHWLWEHFKEKEEERRKGGRKKVRKKVSLYVTGYKGHFKFNYSC